MCPPPLNKKKQKKQVYAHTILTRSGCEARTRGLPQLVSANTTAKHDQKVRIALDNQPLTSKQLDVGGWIATFPLRLLIPG